MRNILYICTKDPQDWNALFPEQAPSPEMDLSVLLIQHGLNLRPTQTSQVFVLNDEGGEDSRPYESISYQNFLERIFLADLALVI